VGELGLGVVVVVVGVEVRLGVEVDLDDAAGDLATGPYSSETGEPLSQPISKVSSIELPTVQVRGISPPATWAPSTVRRPMPAAPSGSEPVFSKV
jgi:hypothetical protein